MSQKLVKELGKLETCRSCKKEIICGQTEYQGTKKLQWQNKDGKAHYKFNVETQELSCNIPVEESTEQGLQNKTLLLEGDDDVKRIDRIHELEGKVRARLTELDKNHPVNEKIGMYVKLLLQK